MSPAPKLLVVDDEANMRELLEIVLGNDGYDVTAVGAVAQAQSLEDQIALVRQAMDTDREALITLNVHFTSAESQAFWPPQLGAT